MDSSVFDGDFENLLDRARLAGVDRILAVGSDLVTSRRAVELASRFEQIYAAVGVHPHEADRFDQEAEEIKTLLGAPKVVAVGEIGLDYFRSYVSKEVQLNAFRRQLEWAVLSRFPVSVHNRSADKDVLQELGDVDVTAVLHCFSGTREFANSALELGMYLSFAGNLTFPKSGDLRRVAQEIPTQRLLIETDAPVLAPQPWRGKRNEPSFITATLNALSQERNTDPQALGKVITGTADQIFGWRSA